MVSLFSIPKGFLFRLLKFTSLSNMINVTITFKVIVSKEWLILYPTILLKSHEVKLETLEVKVTDGNYNDNRANNSVLLDICQMLF